MANAYVVLVRPSMEGAVAEVLDVSLLIGMDLKGMAAANKMMVRMGEAAVYDIKKEEQLANFVSVLHLRARFNNAEGPFLVKTEEPIEGDDWDQLVRNPTFMDRMRKEMKL
jgi:hypothetical protein